MNRQGHDVGEHYRSAIFCTSDLQRKAVEAYISELEESGVFKNPIVTQIQDLSAFYPAEVEHQEYYKNNSSQPYCQFVIKPKLDIKNEHLAKQ